jgi:hypothetical protein
VRSASSTTLVVSSKTIIEPDPSIDPASAIASKL